MQGGERNPVRKAFVYRIKFILSFLEIIHKYGVLYQSLGA
jgi:hypothetical protein